MEKGFQSENRISPPEQLGEEVDYYKYLPELVIEDYDEVTSMFRRFAERRAFFTLKELLDHFEINEVQMPEDPLEQQALIEEMQGDIQTYFDQQDLRVMWIAEEDKEETRYSLAQIITPISKAVSVTEQDPPSPVSEPEIKPEASADKPLSILPETSDKPSPALVEAPEELELAANEGPLDLAGLLEQILNATDSGQLRTKGLTEALMSALGIDFPEAAGYVEVAKQTGIIFVQPKSSPKSPSYYGLQAHNLQSMERERSLNKREMEVAEEVMTRLADLGQNGINGQLMKRLERDMPDLSGVQFHTLLRSMISAGLIEAMELPGRDSKSKGMRIRMSQAAKPWSKNASQYLEMLRTNGRIK